MTTEKRFSSGMVIARIAWAVPAILTALCAYEAKVAVDLGTTNRDGIPLVAEVTRYERSDRKDVTQVELDLRVPMPDGTVFEREKLSLPYSIGHRVDQDTLHVRVLPGTGQEIVISSIVGTQRRIAISNAAMSLIAMLMAFAGVFAWNRYLKSGGSVTVPRGEPHSE